MSGLADLAVPGAGTVAQALSTIRQLCGEMHESQDACRRLHQRLKGILDELKKMEKKKRLSPPDALDKYVAVVAKALLHVERYRGKKLVFRLMKHQAMTEELRLMNEEVDVLCQTLNITNADAVMNWKQVLEADQRIQQELMASSVDDAQVVLKELQDTRSQLETILTLKFETEQRSEQQSPEMTKLLKTMMGTVIRASMTSVPKLPPWFLPPYEIHFNPEPFARGSFATLHRGVWGADTNVVVKCFLVDGVEVDERTRQNIEAEMNIWYQFDHPNVAKLLGASHISTPPFIVCEDATHGDLCSYLSRSSSNKPQMWRLLYQAGLGLEYIHKKSVVHGDLKLNNILVGADGRAKLSDFGLSAVKTSSVLSETEGEAAFTAGALRWRAPECMKKAPTFASDVYSFAMCIIEAVSGEPPFAFLDDDSVHEKLRNGEIPEKPAHMSTEAWELVVAMTNADPEQRIGLSQVLAKLKVLSGDEGRTLLQSNKKAATSGTPSLREDISPGAVGPQLDIDMIVDLLDNMATQEKGEQEQMLLQLVQLCVKDEDRPVMYEANAIHILTDLVKNGRTYNTKLYALQCLKWSAIFDSKLSRPEFDALRASVPEAPVKDLSSLVNCMKTGSDHEQEKAVIRCACIATRGLGGIFRDVAVLQPLVALWQSVSDAQKLWLEMTQPLASFLQSGNSTLKLWAAEVIGSLVWGNEAIRAEIMRAEVVHPLVGLLRIGTNEQKHRASYALQYIALQKEANEMIVRKGGVEPLIALTGLGTIQQKQTTTALLESLVVSKYVNNAVIHREKSISMLVALLLVGSGEQKETAAAALVNLLETDESRAEVARKRGIPPLLKLLRAGTNSQKGYAAGALMNLASNQEARQEISREGGVAELVELTWSGNEQQKTCAVGALSHLSSNVNIGASVARSGGVDSLLELARIGTNQQRDYAISAIRNLTTGDEVHTEIVNQGGVKTFIDLLQSGTDHQKDGAVRILMNLSTNDAARSEIVSKGGVSPLLKLMQTGTDEQKELIASGLGNLVHSDEGRSEIARGGGIGPLVGLLRSGSEQQKVYAVETIETLAKSNEKIRAELVREGSVPLLKAMGKSGSEQQRESAARALQQLNGGCCSLM